MEIKIERDGERGIVTLVGFGQCPKCDKIGLLITEMGTDLSEGRKYIRVKCILCGFSAKIDPWWDPPLGGGEAT